MSITIEQKAPDFRLEDQDMRWHSLTDYKGEWLLLYFYPKDDTPGCTKEACSMRDNMSNFNHMKLKVLGISVDSVISHKKFADKYKLTFPLLSDKNKEMVKTYEVWAPKKFMGKEFLGVVRSSFLINPEGKIAKIYEKVKPEGHAQEVLADIGQMHLK